MQKLKIKSSNGFLAAVVHGPENETDKLAVLCPGFLDSKDYAHLVALAEMLRELGYTSVRFDPTGTWESSGDISDYDTTQYLEDVKTVIDYMNEGGKYKNILIGGHSRGGRIAVLSAARDSRITQVLGIMPSSSEPDKDKKEEWRRAGIKISQRDLPDDRNNTREYKVPFSHVVDLEKYNVLKEAGEITAPTVLIAGELDDTVPAKDVEELSENIKSRKKFVIVPSIGHDYRFDKKEIGIVNDVIKKQLEEMM